MSTFCMICELAMSVLWWGMMHLACSYPPEWHLHIQYDQCTSSSSSSWSLADLNEQRQTVKMRRNLTCMSCWYDSIRCVHASILYGILSSYMFYVYFYFSYATQVLYRFTLFSLLCYITDDFPFTSVLYVWNCGKYTLKGFWFQRRGEVTLKQLPGINPWPVWFQSQKVLGSSPNLPFMCRISVCVFFLCSWKVWVLKSTPALWHNACGDGLRPWTICVEDEWLYVFLQPSRLHTKHLVHVLFLLLKQGFDRPPQISNPPGRPQSFIRSSSPFECESTHTVGQQIHCMVMALFVSAS